MAHNTSHRRTLAAAPDPQTPMDPTQRKPKPNPSAADHRRHPQPLIHPLPDPTTAPPSTIQNISHRFSKLYANHKKLVSHSSKPGPHPQPDPHFQTRKDLPFSSVSDSACATLTKSKSKSSSQKERNSNFSLAIAKIMEKNHQPGTKTKVRENDDFKKQSSSSFEAAHELMSLKSLENVEMMKGFEEGGNNKRRSSLSSSCIPPTVNNGGRRRSFCNSQVELADFLSCSGVKVVAVDMPPFMQVHAVDCARKAHDSLEKFTSKTLAYTLKKEFDGVYGPAWHCIVGTSFGSFVTHSVGGFMYFSMDHKLYILLFKTTVQRAE